MRTEDIIALEQLVYRYADAIDACDLDRFLAVFTPEARLHIYHPDAAEPFAQMRGHGELGTIPGRMRDMFAQTMHVMSNPLIEIAGDSASGSVLCTARHLTLDHETAMNVMIRYHDRYAHDGSDWRIADRAIRFLWSEQHAAIDSGFGQ